MTFSGEWLTEAFVETLTSKEKAALRNAAQRLKPAVFVGKRGITPALLQEMGKALESGELVKVAFKADREALGGLVESLEAQSNSQCVGGVGKRRSFYRRNGQADDSFIRT